MTAAPPDAVGAPAVPAGGHDLHDHGGPGPRPWWQAWEEASDEQRAAATAWVAARRTARR